MITKKDQNVTTTNMKAYPVNAHDCPDGPCLEALRSYEEALTKGRELTGDAPDCLKRLGLIEEYPDRPGYYFAIPPALAAARATHFIERDIVELKGALDLRRRSFASAEAAYQRAINEHGPGFTIIPGTEPINDLLDQEVAACTGELRAVHPRNAAPFDALERAALRTTAALRRGVNVRSLHQQTIHSHAPTLEYSRRITDLGGQVRTLGELANWLIICDTRVAFVPVTGDGGPAVVTIRESAIVRYLASHFDLSWERAEPLAGETTNRNRPFITSDLQRTIIRLVVNGHTDSVIAGRVGASTRTVAEHVHRVSSHLGSRSRAELGYLVAKTDLLAQRVTAEGKVSEHG